jgi:adenylate cyclase
MGRFFRGHLSAKILGPYLVLMFFVAALGSFVVVRLVTGSLEQRFVNQLLDAGKSVNDNVLRVQREQVELIRLMVNTEGVDQAIAKGDARALQQLLVPLQANSQYDLVDILDAGGREVLALRPQSGPLADAFDPDIGSWTITANSVANRRDEYGNKYSELVHTSFGDVFYSGGPVVDDAGESVGAILVGIPVDELLARLTKDVLANVTVYGSDGAVIQTTLPADVGDVAALKVRPNEYEVVTKQGNVLKRPVRIGNQDYLEVVGGMFVRDSVKTGLGVAIPRSFITQSTERTKQQLTALFCAIVLAVFFIGWRLAKKITGPIMLLVRACQLVASGNLEQRIAVKAEDETGVLAESFNQMVAGLKERNFIRDTFGRYMTKEVSEEILNHGGLKLGGERKVVTMLMSDIRSFTTLSESMTPEDLVAFLNRYFKSMVACIDEYEGVVDKFMGDAILVKYGAPVERPDHARRAMLTALAMRRNLVEFNRELVAAGHEPIRIGIGINTGPVIVGNIGAESRMEYTVIGDVVNATQRTEDLTKDLKTDILVTDTTVAASGGGFRLGEPHMITLRGRTHETAIYPLVGLDDGFSELLTDQGPILAGSQSAVQDMVDAVLAQGPAAAPPGEQRVYSDVI